MTKNAGIGTIALTCLLACTPTVVPTDASRVVDIDAATECVAPGSRAAGDHCRCGTDCAEGMVCITEGASWQPQGTCVRSCAGGASCGEGLTCASDTCYRTCETTADCPPEAHCLNGACSPSCTSDAECLSGNCNEYNGRCLPAGEMPPGVGLDQPCSANGDCRSDICSGGQCVSPCWTTVGTCPEEAVCLRISGQPDLGICHPACSDDVPCTIADTHCTVLAPGIPAACFPIDREGCRGRGDSPTAGGGCGCDADCDDDGSRCVTETSTGFPQGLCLSTCSGPADCAASHTCVGGVCLERCTNDDACGFGRLCSGTFCYPWCVRDSECESGACDTYRGQCDAPLTAPGGVGDTCESDADCRSDLCSTTTHPDGSCDSYCVIDRGACPDDAVCVPFDARSDGGMCRRPCSVSADCPQAAGRCIAATASVAAHCE